MKKMFVYGYRRINLGDDLFFYILFSRYPDTEFILSAPKEYKKIYEKNTNVKIKVEGRSLLALNRIMSLTLGGRNFRTVLASKCDGAVLISGSIFSQTNRNIRSCNFEPDTRTQPNTYVLGVNFGPYSSENFRVKAKEYFQSCKDVCFRETYSEKLFRDVTTVRMAPDIVFQIGKGKSRSKSSEKHAVVSVINMDKRISIRQYAEDYYQFILQSVKYLNELGIFVTLMSFCQAEGDEEAIDMLLNRIDDKNMVDYYFYRGDISEALQKIDESEYIIATRFHSMILGWTLGKKTLPILYSDKMEHVISDCQYQGLKLKLKQLNNWSMDKMLEWLKSPIFNVVEFIEKSELQFRKLDEYLNENE